MMSLGGSDPPRPALLRPNPFPRLLGASAAPSTEIVHRAAAVAGNVTPPVRGSELVAQVDADRVQLHILISIDEGIRRVVVLGAEIVVAILRADDELVGQRVVDAGTHGPADIGACG